MYRDLPLAEQLHSCYLNRAMDYFMHTQGKLIIPNVSWGDSRSYEFCFDGVPKDSTVAVSTYGCCRSRVDRCYFEDGFVMMQERLSPYSVVLHGPLWAGLNELCEYHDVRLLHLLSYRAAKEVHHG